VLDHDGVLDSSHFKAACFQNAIQRTRRSLSRRE
jgi:hypothetical protein